MTDIETSSLEDVFEALTDKQREVLALLAEGMTSKEIANEFEISESAVVQRIEAVRSKAGGILRKDLVRQFRYYEAQQAVPCNGLTGKKIHITPIDGSAEQEPQEHSEPELLMADAVPFQVPAPWADRYQPRVVPEVLEGRGATLRRWAAACVMAVAMAVLMLVLLAVADSLGDRFSVPPPPR